jgi:predicted acetyltransferase
MAAEFSADGDTRHDRDAVDFAGYLARSADAALGLGLRPGRVPSSTYWIVLDGRILGTSRLRHQLTSDLEIEGGHIGYDVRPTERGRGIGTVLLRLTLDRAAALGLRSVRITCDADNVGSIRVIEKNGGRLIGQVLSRTSGKPVRRYDISTVNSP